MRKKEAYQYIFVYVLMALAGVLLGYSLIYGVGLIVNSPAEKWNGTRFSVVLNYFLSGKLYYEPGQPILPSVYGPLSYLPYFYAAQFKDLAQSIRVGSLTAVMLSLLPLISLFWIREVVSRVNKDSFREVLKGLFIKFCLFFATVISVSFQIDSTEYAMFAIHCDAPTHFILMIGFIILIYSSEKYRPYSAIFHALALFSKYLAFPAFLISLLFFCLDKQYRNLFKYCFIYFATSLVALIVIEILFGLNNFLFNTISIMGNHPMDFSEAHILRMFKSLGPTIVLVLLLAASRINLVRGYIPRDIKLFLLISLFFIPSAFLGFFKRGGWYNNFSYIDYYVVIAGTLSAIDIIFRWINAWGVFKRVRNYLFIYGLGLAAGMILTIPYQLERKDYEVYSAYSLLKEKPGAYYFPGLPAAHYFAEGKFFNHSYSVYDISIAGKLNLNDFNKGLPEDNRIILCSNCEEYEYSWFIDGYDKLTNEEMKKMKLGRYHWQGWKKTD